MARHELNELLRLYKQAQSRKRNWEDMWREAYDYVLPQRTRFFHDEVHVVQGEKRTQEIYDETAVVGLPAFASRTLGGIFPPMAKAFRLVPGPRVRAKNLGNSQMKQLQAELDKATEMIHESIWNSNFQSEAHEAFIDLGIGTGNLEVRGGEFPGDLVFKSVQLHEIALLPGPDDLPRAWFRTRRMSLADIKRKWPNADFNEAMANSFRAEKEGKESTGEANDKVFEVVYRDFDDKKDETYHYQVVHAGFKHILLEATMSGAGSNPVVTFRWAKASGEDYGRGPVLQVMPAIRTANETVKLVLENAQMAIGGAYFYDDDGVFEPENITIEPGVFIPRAPGSSIEALQSGAKFDVSDLILSDQRQNIRKALFIDELEREAKTPLSATEVAERTANVARSMGAVAGRLRHEFLLGVVRRVAYILKKQGTLQIPVIDGKEVELVPRSPLMRAQNQQDVNDFLRFQEAVQFTAQDMAPIYTNQPRAVAHLAQLFGIDERLLNTENERTQAIESMQQIAQQGGLGGSEGPTQG